MKVLKDIEYKNNQKLDLYIPDNKDFSTFVMFHGGGIESGDKTEGCYVNVANALVKRGYGVAYCNYSLYPNTKFPDYLYECAAAVKYVFDNISKYGGNKKIYVGGQSAGAYISMMLCLNKEYLNSVNINPLDVAGWVSDAGQMTDHFNVIKYETGQDPWLQRITKFAPLYYVDKNANSSPILLTSYEHDMVCRVEQNMLLKKAIEFFNDKVDITLLILPGNHCAGSCTLNSDGEPPIIKDIMDWLNK